MLHLLQLKMSLDPTLFKAPQWPHVLDVYSVHMSKVQFLTKTFNYIILPNFESQEIVKKNKIRCE